MTVDTGAESRHGVRAGKDTETKCLSRLEPGVPINLQCPDPPRLTVQISTKKYRLKVTETVRANSGKESKGQKSGRCSQSDIV